VGSVVTGAFLDAGHEVTVLDSLASGGQGLLGYVPNRRFRFLRGDVRDARAVREAVKGHDAIVHLAAVVGFGACNADPVRAESINVAGTRTLLDARARGQLLLYASTGSVYGAVRDGLCHEGIDPAPLSLYGRTKLAAERMALEAGDALAFRFATAFGMSPRMRIDLLVNEFVYSAARRGFIVVYDKDARRTFIHVRDMARAFLFGLERFSALAGESFNAGSERLNLTKDDLARLILARRHYFLTYGPIGADEDQRDYAVSYEKLRGRGFDVAVSIEEGVDELLRGMDLLYAPSPFGNV
jgi:nucleoside-diphosphate-sugar epimerase